MNDYGSLCFDSFTFCLKKRLIKILAFNRIMYSLIELVHTFPLWDVKGKLLFVYSNVEIFNC